MAQPDIDTGMPIIKMETEEGEGIYASTSRFSRREETDQGLTLPPKIQSSDAWRFDPVHALTDEEFEALLGPLQPEPLASNPENQRDEEWLHSLFTDDLEFEEPPRKRKKTKSPSRRQSRATLLRANESAPPTAPPVVQGSVPCTEPLRSPSDSGYGTSISSISGPSFNRQVPCDSCINEQATQHDSLIGKVQETIDKHHIAAPNNAQVPLIASQRDDVDDLSGDDFVFNTGGDEPPIPDNDQSKSLSSSANRDDEVDRRDSLVPRVTPTDPDTPIPSIEPHDPVGAKRAAASNLPIYTPKQMSRWPAWMRKLHWETSRRYRSADPPLQLGLEVNMTKLSESNAASKTFPSNASPKPDHGYNTLPKSKSPQEKLSQEQHQEQNPRKTAAMVTLMDHMGDTILHYLSFLPTPKNNFVNAGICKMIVPLLEKCDTDPEFGASVVFLFFQKIQEKLQRQLSLKPELTPEETIEVLQDLVAHLKAPSTIELHEQLHVAQTEIKQLKQQVEQAQAAGNSRGSSTFTSNLTLPKVLSAGELSEQLHIAQTEIKQLKQQVEQAQASGNSRGSSTFTSNLTLPKAPSAGELSEQLLIAKSKIKQLEEKLEQAQASGNSRDSSPTTSHSTSSTSTSPGPANFTCDGSEDLGFYCMVLQKDGQPCLGHNFATSKDSNGKVTMKKKCQKCKRNVTNDQRLKVTRSMFVFNNGTTELRVRTLSPAPCPTVSTPTPVAGPVTPPQAKKRGRKSPSADEPSAKKSKPHEGFSITPDTHDTLRFRLGAARHSWMGGMKPEQPKKVEQPKKPEEPVIDLTGETAESGGVVAGEAEEDDADLMAELFGGGEE
ncbi:hypothetical protein BDZ45DRAFT_746876 [Acephala macrosclerotiorum]|nr:hypothetical protein BDZ45DRAFT_746876 [Acephala macrosclerotiorum]